MAKIKKMKNISKVRVNSKIMAKNEEIVVNTRDYEVILIQNEKHKFDNDALGNEKLQMFPVC